MVFVAKVILTVDYWNRGTFLHFRISAILRLNRSSLTIKDEKRVHGPWFPCTARSWRHDHGEAIVVGNYRLHEKQNSGRLAIQSHCGNLSLYWNPSSDEILERMNSTCRTMEAHHIVRCLHSASSASYKRLILLRLALVLLVQQKSFRFCWLVSVPAIQDFPWIPVLLFLLYFLVIIDPSYKSA